MHVDHAIADSVADPYLDALQAVLVGQMSPEQAAEQVESAAATVLGRHLETTRDGTSRRYVHLRRRRWNVKEL